MYRRYRNCCLLGILVTTAALQLEASAQTMVKYDAPMTGTIEAGVTYEARPDTRSTANPRPTWNIVKLPANTLIYKGMDVACANVRRNDDFFNRFTQGPNWMGNVDVAEDYARRSTAKVYRTKHEQVPRQFMNGEGRVVRHDEAVASIVEYRASRDLNLFPIIDENNIKALLGMIMNNIDWHLQTDVGKKVLEQLKQRHPDGSKFDVNKDLLYAAIADLRDARRGTHRAEWVDKIVFDLDAQRGERGNVPLGMTKEDMEFAIKQIPDEERAGATPRLYKRNKRIAGKLIDTLIGLQREWFVVRFATGYGIGWDQQKAILGRARLSKRGLTTVTSLGDLGSEKVGEDGNKVYELYIKDKKVATIGHRPTDFNRISMMNRDLELIEIIKKYVNVDGYWAPKVPSLWHRDHLFHSEIALVATRNAIEPTGTCMKPSEGKPLALNAVDWVLGLLDGSEPEDDDVLGDDDLELGAGEDAYDAREGAVAIRAADFKTFMTRIAEQALGQTPVPAAVTKAIASWGLELVISDDSPLHGTASGRELVVVARRDLEAMTQTEDAIFTIAHELGHQFEFGDVFRPVREAPHGWVPRSGLSDRLASEFWADACATRWMKSAGFTEHQIVDAADRLFGKEAETAAHPAGKDRLANIKRVYALP